MLTAWSRQFGKPANWLVNKLLTNSCHKLAHKQVRLTELCDCLTICHSINMSTKFCKHIWALPLVSPFDIQANSYPLFTKRKGEEGGGVDFLINVSCCVTCTKMILLHYIKGFYLFIFKCPLRENVKYKFILGWYHSIVGGLRSHPHPHILVTFNPKPSLPPSAEGI